MAGTILENLSNRKLSVVIAIILIIQIISFFTGAFIAPSPSSTEQVLATKCLPKSLEEFSIPRDTFSKGLITSKNCQQLSSSLQTNGTIIFAFQLPLPREGVQLDYSRWMSNMIAIIVPDITYSSWIRPSNKKKTLGDDFINGTINLRVRLGVKNVGDVQWKEYAEKGNLKRTMNCRIAEDKRADDYKYDCDMIQLFELQSLYYDFYLINIQILGGIDIAEHNGLLTDMSLVAIHQNGGFTKIWLSMKTVFTCITLFTLIWFWKRLGQLHRDMTLLEKTLTILGCAMTQLNLPLEFLTLWLDMPFMNFVGDIRQGVLYCALLSFWIIFTGEHLLDGIHRSRISSYYKQLSVVLVASTALFVFDSSERGVQWIDPFFTIWEVESHLALIFIITASIASATYLAFLSYHIWLVLRNISSKQTSLPSMSSTRRLIYQGIIYRFKFLLLATLVCAAVTIVAYILGQVSEDPLQWEDDMYMYKSVEWTSAMFTTVYAMWNCYIITLLILYAPSHKGLGPNAIDAMSEEIEFNRLTDTDDRNEGSLDTFGSTDNNPGASSSEPQEEESAMKLLQDIATKQSID